MTQLKRAVNCDSWVLEFYGGVRVYQSWKDAVRIAATLARILRMTRHAKG